jgi:hypothetical protein
MVFSLYERSSVQTGAHLVQDFYLCNRNPRAKDDKRQRKITEDFRMQVGASSDLREQGQCWGNRDLAGGSATGGRVRTARARRTGRKKCPRLAQSSEVNQDGKRRDVLRRAPCSCSMAKASSADDDRNSSLGRSCVSAHKIGIGSQETTERKNILLLQLGRNELGSGLFVRHASWRRRIGGHRSSAATPDLPQRLANQKISIRQLALPMAE